MAGKSTQKANRPNLNEIKSVWERTYGKITRIHNKGRPEKFKNDDGSHTLVSYMDLSVALPGRPSEFIKCAISGDALDIMRGKVYNGLLQHEVTVPKPSVGCFAIIEGYVKRNVERTLPDKSTRLETLAYLTTINAIQVDMHRSPAPSAKI